MEGVSAQDDERTVRRIVDLLFHHTDDKDWTAGAALFVEGPVKVDMTSLAGGEPMEMTAAELFGGFEKGLHAQKLSHHMASNVVVALAGDHATARAHGYAINALQTTEPPRLWETWGVYTLGFLRTPQ